MRMHKALDIISSILSTNHTTNVMKSFIYLSCIVFYRLNIRVANRLASFFEALEFKSRAIQIAVLQMVRYRFHINAGMAVLSLQYIIEIYPELVTHFAAIS